MITDKLSPNQQEAWLELYRIFRDVQEQAKEHPEDAYWQGKKDGIRTAWIYFNEALGLEDEADSTLRVRESSWTSRSTDLEILKAQVRSAMYYIGEALWMADTGEKLHPLSRINWMQWWNGYKRLAEKGLVEEVNDTCFD